MAYKAPLSTILSRVGAVFTADFERRLSAAGFEDLSFSLGTNVLRFLEDEPVRMGALVELSGVTKQAISQQVGYLASRGYVRVTPDASDVRVKLVQLTDSGRRSQVAARSAFKDVERDWQRRFGREEIRDLRLIAERILTTLRSAG